MGALPGVRLRSDVLKYSQSGFSENSGMHVNRPEVLSFLDAIKDDPEDDTLRLILADWLADQGDEDRRDGADHPSDRS